MYRINFLAQNAKFPIIRTGTKRHFCVKKRTNVINTKMYVVDVEKPPLDAEKSLQQSKLLEVKNGDQWERLLCITKEIILRYKKYALAKYINSGAQEKISAIRKTQAEKFQGQLKHALREVSSEKLPKFALVSKEQWQVFKSSTFYAKLLQLPSTSIDFSKDVMVKVKQYWMVFNESQLKEQIMHVAKEASAYGRKGATELIKFAKDVYNAPVSGKPRSL